MCQHCENEADDPTALYEVSIFHVIEDKPASELPVICTDGPHSVDIEGMGMPGFSDPRAALAIYTIACAMDNCQMGVDSERSDEELGIVCYKYTARELPDANLDDPNRDIEVQRHNVAVIHRRSISPHAVLDKHRMTDIIAAFEMPAYERPETPEPEPENNT